ncbi:MAG: hypothetical protein U1E15_12700 [Hyphomicrobiales bacterium]
MLFAILALLGGAAFWWWRIKAIGDAASDVHDAAGRMWGKYKRKKFLAKVNDSLLNVIDDPATAAVILMHAIQTEDGLSGPQAEHVLREEVTGTMGIADPTEIITFGKWTAGHADDASTIIRRYGDLWKDNLTPAERNDLVGMIERVSGNGGTALTTAQKARIDRLKQRLGLQV